MPLYLTLTSRGLFMLNFLEKRGAQKCASQDYFRANQIAGSSMENTEGAYKKCLMKITISHCRSPVIVYWRD